MLKYATIRFTTDTFGAPVKFIDEPLEPTAVDPDAPDTPAATFMKQALLVSKVALDCSAKAFVDQFVITGAEPEGTSRRLIFKIDDTLYYFKNNALVAYPYAGEFTDIINNGNKVATLAALNDITAFVGKKIYPIIALQAPSDAAEFPTIKVALATRAATEQFVKTIDSPVYELDLDTQTITNIEASTNEQGEGVVNYVLVRLRNGETWSSFMNLADAIGRSANAVQFRTKYTVTTTDGSDSAQVTSIVVSHSAGEAVVTGDTALLFTTVANYEAGLRTCYAVIRHAPLVDATIEALVNFLPAPKHRELITIGTGTGQRQEIALGDSGIVPASLKLYVNGLPFYDFDFSTELSTVILTAAKNAAIAASYDYDYGAEEWLTMTAEQPQPYNDDDGTYATRFNFTLPDDGTDKTISNVCFRLKRLSGKATESLGTATGKTQLFTLKHKAIPSKITFSGNVSFTFDEASGILSVVAARGTALNVTYNWRGEAPSIVSYAAGWSAT